jgi:alkylation response protein AidB-like acyl-CoA dehydrogenase
VLDTATLATATTEFIRREVLPIDDEHDGDIHAAGGDETRVRLQAAARRRGLLAPHAPADCGGGGLGMLARAPVFEAAGYSLFGPMALNISAPDEGNMHLLDVVGTPAQRDAYLKPLVRGQVRSAFAMTEPPPGAGSDPSMLATQAIRVQGGWVLNGEKRFITGAEGASFYITMARTGGAPGSPSGATMFMVPAGSEGAKITRHIATTDRSMLGGHCAMTFTDVFVPDDQVLGEAGQGFRHAQARLGPARLTHIMRWTGAARRAHDVATAYVADRRGFGGRLADLGMVQQLIADNEIDLTATRCLLVEACRELDAGGSARPLTSIAKTFAAEALNRVADRAIQLCGGLGVSQELPVAKIARELRAFRIYDGPSEVHRWSIAKRALRAHSDSVR